MITTRSVFAAGRLFLMLAGACLLIGSSAQAQNGGAYQDGGYKVGEHSGPADNQAPASVTPPPTATPRLARIDYVSGKVTWRPNDGASWSKASVNQALREGGQVWVEEGGRAEIRFDDGSMLRLGNGAVVTLQSLYSDDKGEFTQIKMLSGLATLRPKQTRSVFEVDTPIVTVETTGSARVRLGVGDTVEVGVRFGSATISGKQGKTTLNPGDFVALHNVDQPYDLQNLPREDSWERWNDERDRILTEETRPVHRRGYPVYVPAPGPSVWFSLDIPIFTGHRHWDRWR